MPPLTKQTWTARREGLPFGRQTAFPATVSRETRNRAISRAATLFATHADQAAAQRRWDAREASRQAAFRPYIPPTRTSPRGRSKSAAPQTDVQGRSGAGIQDADTRLDRARRHSTWPMPRAESANICSLAGRCARNRWTGR